ncbi:unnamed protein product [Thelazia callipaeda]|uniref:MARVEL domain-containing protein n=1 Tax=Thelazia callipaeda TaxID=103827 RepID=A0A0N5CY05_THECL|nr:unnamed protein product [Thelazia callipaeda]
MDRNDREPLMTTKLPNSSPQIEKGPSELNTANVAEVWPCRFCGLLLGICHLSLGTTLLVFDVTTNNISGTVFAITASLSFIICGIFSFISARRLDRPAQILLLFFGVFSAAMSTIMFMDSAATINYNCDQGICHSKVNHVHTVLLCYALIELTLSFATTIVCFRSLRRAYRVRKASSPYSTLIEGDYDAFYIKPRTVNGHKSSSTLLPHILK